MKKFKMTCEVCKGNGCKECYTRGYFYYIPVGNEKGPKNSLESFNLTDRECKIVETFLKSKENILKKVKEESEKNQILSEEREAKLKKASKGKSKARTKK